MATAAACILWFAVIMYSVFGGADYGAGFWDLFAGGTRRGERPRGLIDHAMAPVWEANNVWLIFAAIVCWTAFSEAFGSIMKTLFIPVILAGVGIVIRGSGFAFRKLAERAGRKRALTAAFGISSVITPFMLGAALGGIASGRVPPGNTQGSLWASWLNSTSIAVGIFGVLISAFIAATFLIADADRYYDDVMAAYFRIRAFLIGILAGLAALAGLFVLRSDSPYIYRGLLHEGLPFVIASGVFGLLTLGALWRQLRGSRVRVLAVATVVSVLLGWGVAQYPYILPTTLTIDQAAASGPVLTWLVVVFIIGVVLVAPALLLLWVLDQRSRLDEGAEATAPARHRVVIVGGGFGGLFASKSLAMAPVDVTLVDRHNYHLFQPLLYQVSTGILSEGQIAPPLRDVAKNARNCRVELAEVTGFDLDQRLVFAIDPVGKRMEIPYDSLIVAAGGRTSYFGHDEFEHFAPGMKTIDDALELRRRIFGAFEVAELEEDAEERRRWLTFVVVGAGPTGCELAGQIRELAERSLRHNFRSIDPTTARVVLVDGGKEPLASFGENLSGKGRKELEHMGVELHMGCRATNVDFEGIEVASETGNERIHAHTVIWAAGVAASPLAKQLADASGAEADRAGRVAVLPDCTLPGHPEVFAIGDLMSLNHLPGVAEVAMQQGLFAGRTIRRRLQGNDRKVPFKYVDLGSMATIGRFRAVVEFKGIRLSGFAGWLMWLGVHLVFLTGFRNRLGALFRWTGALLGRHRDERAFTVRRATAGDDSYASVLPTPTDDDAALGRKPRA
jgi:NADH:ubiquinone reductase (H+-translocating)